MKRFWVIFGVILGMMGCAQQEGEQLQEPIPVQVFVVRQDSLVRYVEIPASLEGEQETHLVARIAGKLESVKVAVGQRVTSGEVLGSMETAMLVQQVAQAEAARAAAEAALTIARREFERMQRLAQEQAISPQQFDQVKTRYDQARAQMQQADAAYRLAKEQWRNALFIAPFNARVAAIYFDEGEFVPVGQPVFRLVTTQQYKADLAVPDAYWNEVQPGQQVLATFPDVPGVRFRGKIVRKDDAIDPFSRTFGVRVELRDDYQRLRSGMFGVFRIAVKKVQQVPVIPDNAVASRTEVVIDPRTGQSRYQQRYYVFVVQQGVARRVPVTLALTAADRVAIARGLQPGDSLIVVGQKLVKDGQPVKVVE